MSYSGKLFDIIPYEVRVSNTPIYSKVDVEAMLSVHYGSVFAPMIYVKRVFNDDKNSGNIIYVDYFINSHNEDCPWFGNKENAVALKFQSAPASSEEIDYAYQMFIAIQKHFTHDSSLTIIHPDDINKHFTREIQIEAYRSTKEFIKTHQTIFDHMIKSDTPARLSFLIRAHLAGLEVDLLDTPDEIIKKLEQNLRSKENIVKRACKELGITQKELAEKLGVSKPSVERWAQSEVPEQSQKQIETLLENIQLKQELEELKSAIKTIVKHA